MNNKIRLAAVATLGAFLAFVLEPMVGRLVAPIFGGAVHVWTVCIMVFQGVLLAGYTYAHLIAPRIGKWHFLVISLPLLWLPVAFTGDPRPEAPVIALMFELVLRIGAPFFGVACAAVLAQQWWTASEEGEPYILYSASNLGSLGGLLAYPVVVEPFFGLTWQTRMWAIGYLGFVALSIWSWKPVPPKPPALENPEPVHYAAWMGLAFVPSALMLAVTNVIATEIGSFPLVWVPPLALYLASFIVAFRDTPVFPWLRPFWPDLLALMILAALFVTETNILLWSLAVYFVVCWLIHGELYRRRPDPALLTHYYLAIATGGWIGGIAVSLGAPVVFEDIWEVEATLAIGAVVLMATIGLYPRALPKWTWIPRILITGTVLYQLGELAIDRTERNVLAQERNQYGVFRVSEYETWEGRPYRLLANGHTRHGMQYIGEEKAFSYFHELGPNQKGLALRKKPGRIGVIGLGAGSINAAVEPGETMVFYEINPDSEPLARKWFTHLRPETEVRLGDARLMLQTEGGPDYDAIFLDAFAGDAIPTHLLTAEAFTIYLDRLTEDGVIVLHISNRYLDLRGVLEAAAKHHGLAMVSKWELYPAIEDELYETAATVVMSPQSHRLQPLRDEGWDEGRGDCAESELWTDDWFDLWGPLAGMFLVD